MIITLRPLSAVDEVTPAGGGGPGREALGVGAGLAGPQAVASAAAHTAATPDPIRRRIEQRNRRDVMTSDATDPMLRGR
jgi:hypothetical protein